MGCSNCKDKVIYQDTLLILLQQGYRKRDHNQAVSSARHIVYYLYEELWVAILFNLLTEKVTIYVLSFQTGNLYCIYFPSRGILCLKKKSHESLIIYILPHTTVFVFLIECNFSVFLFGGERERVCVCVCVCMHACILGWGK